MKRELLYGAHHYFLNCGFETPIRFKLVVLRISKGYKANVSCLFIGCATANLTRNAAAQLLREQRHAHRQSKLSKLPPVATAALQ